MNAMIIAMGLVVGAPGPKEKPKEAPSIVGEWTLESNMIGGKERFKKRDGDTYVFTDDGKYLMRRNGVDVKDTVREFKVDAKTNPMQIDLAVGLASGPMVPGIYKIDGDTLTICYDASTSTRPQKFDSDKGSRATVLVYKRVKK